MCIRDRDDYVGWTGIGQGDTLLPPIAMPVSYTHLIGTDKRIYLVKMENGNLKELSCGKLEMMDMHVHELYLDRTANTLFIGTFEKGLYIYDLNIQKIVRPEVELTDVNITRLSPCLLYTSRCV